MTHVKPYDELEDHCIFGVDPGKKTGIALWVPAISHKHIFASAELDEHEIKPWMHAQIASAASVTRSLLRPCLIAVENFTQAKGGAPMSAQPHAMRVIGNMRTIADDFCCGFTTNQPSAAKKLANNERMRKIGWYKATKDGHETDARREILITVSRFHKDLYRDIIQEENEYAAR